MPVVGLWDQLRPQGLYSQPLPGDSFFQVFAQANPSQKSVTRAARCQFQSKLVFREETSSKSSCFVGRDN